MLVMWMFILLLYQQLIFKIFMATDKPVALCSEIVFYSAFSQYTTQNNNTIQLQHFSHIHEPTGTLGIKEMW